jgi:hypothetical protein
MNRLPNRFKLMIKNLKLINIIIQNFYIGKDHSRISTNHLQKTVLWILKKMNVFQIQNPKVLF